MTQSSQAPRGGRDDMPRYPARIENPAGRSAILLVCEHASNEIPPELAGLGLPDALRAAHIAWDPGALGLARALSRRLDAALVHASISRLVYDLNRAPNAPGAIAEKSEMHEIPGNRALTSEQRATRMESVYLPFHDALRRVIAERLIAGTAPVIVTVHSFTPIWFGTPRTVEFGVIHDADARLAQAVWLEAARPPAQGGLDLDTQLNAPYSAADDVTHLLRLQALPYGLANVMLEIRNDLITSESAQAALAESLATVLQNALAQLETGGEQRSLAG